MKTVYRLCLLLVGLLLIFQPGIALAQDETPAEESIELTCSHPAIETTAELGLTFEVKLKYQGSEPRYFELSTTGPEGWTIYTVSIVPAGTRVRGLMLDPESRYGETINVQVYPPPWPPAEPGEYKIIFEVSSDEIKDVKELTAVIVPGYTLALVPVTEGVEGKFSTSATAGRDNYFSIIVQNQGTTTIDNITFSSPRKPTGWIVEFSLDKIVSLTPGEYKTIDVNVKPPPRTIAGDYFPVKIVVDAEQAVESIEMRVTVETPPTGQWVGVGIIVLVIAGLAFVFMRFSRR